MRDLIERLEKAKMPDRALDWEIHCRNGLEGVGAYGSHPEYTRSIDAAMTLVPEGCCADTQERHLDTRTFYRSDEAWARIEAVGGQVFLGAATAATVPIAICAAALKAATHTSGDRE